MGISSQAMPEGIDRCRLRFAAEVAGVPLRRYHGLWLPWIGLGIRVEEKMAPATAASARPEEVHPRFIGGPDGPPASVSVLSMAKTSGVPMDPISTNPKEINVSREKRQVHIRWQDGHESVYGFDLLRKECPCALCNDHRSKQSMSRGLSLTVLSGPVIQAGQIQVTEVKPVGRYALNFVWSDGHDSGIYSYTFLREACPCPTCRGDR